MLTNLIPILLFYFIFSFAVTLSNNINRKRMLKMLIDNNLISNSTENNLNLQFLEQKQQKSKSRSVLPIALGMMGLAFGLVCSAFIIHSLSHQLASTDTTKDLMLWLDIKEAIQLGTPILFASIGVVVAYFIEKKDKKAE